MILFHGSAAFLNLRSHCPALLCSWKQGYIPRVGRAAALPPTCMAYSDVMHELLQGLHHLLVFWSLKELWLGLTWLHSEIEQDSEAGQKNSGSSLTLNPRDKIPDNPSFPWACSPVCAGGRAVGSGWERLSEGSPAGTGILGGNSCISAAWAQRGLRLIWGSWLLSQPSKNWGDRIFNLGGNIPGNVVNYQQL